MKWRFLDCIISFEPWAMIAARKAISLEEYSLLKPFGRKGDFPEGLILECCVEAVRWLVAASSGFAQVSVLSEIEGFRFTAKMPIPATADKMPTMVGMGDVLEIAATVKQRGENDASIECCVKCSDKDAARGEITVALLPLNESFDREFVESMWRELYGAA